MENSFHKFLLINDKSSFANSIITLALMNENDFERLYEVASDPLIWEQHPANDRYKREVFQRYFDGAILSKGAFLVFDSQTMALIGSTRFYDFKPEKSSIAIGYTFLARKYWGGIYNKAMKKMLMDYAFQYVDNVIFHVGSNNIRSQKAVLKLGAKQIGEVDAVIEYELHHSNI